MRYTRTAMVAALLALPLVWPAGHGAAQSRQQQTPRSASTTSNVPNAVQGFSKNRDQPIQIEASTLEVVDRNKIATFRGKVHVKQGDTELRCNVLVVHYEESATGGTSGARAAAPTPDQQQRIRRLEAKGNVIVTQKEQTATGDTGDFDMRKNLITLHGNVVVSQGRNVLRGDRLTVDMTTAVSHLESTRSGRVQGLFQPSAREEDSRRDSAPMLPRPR